MHSEVDDGVMVVCRRIEAVMLIFSLAPSPNLMSVRSDNSIDSELRMRFEDFSTHYPTEPRNN